MGADGFLQVLTGTPVHNNLGELWGLLHWLYPNVFTPATQNLFRESFDLAKGSYSIPFLTAAKKLLEKIMLRRTKAIVEMTVPPKEELTVFIPLTEAQRFWTYRLLTRVDTMDLKSIFTSKIEADSDDVIDHGRRQVQEILKEQMNAQKKAKPAGAVICWWMFTPRLITRNSLETVDEPPHPVENGLRPVSNGTVREFSALVDSPSVPIFYKMQNHLHMLSANTLSLPRQSSLRSTRYLAIYCQRVKGY